MKLGLISDIHSDLQSLNKALDLLNRQGVARVVCLGDVVEKGPDGDAVVRLLQARQIPCVRGNHDEASPGNQRWLLQHADLTHPAMLGRLLAEDVLEYLKNLPASLRFVWKDKQGHRVRVLMAHGTPSSNVDYLFPNTAPDKYKRIAQETGVDVILFGHTHTPTCCFFGGVWFFNPGAVCQENTEREAQIPQGYLDTPGPTCAMLMLPALDFLVLDIHTGRPVDVPCIR